MRVLRLFVFLKNRIIRTLSEIAAPKMIWGYKRYDGMVLDNTRISSSTYIGTSSRLDIEDNVFVCHFNVIDASGGLCIETGCQLTNFITVQTHSSHRSIRLYGAHYKSIQDPIGYVKGGVRIGEYTFVGPHTTIMPGTTIGKGCIISAHSYLNGNYPDFSVIRGVPARVVGNTQEMDKPFLLDHPELDIYYREWATDANTSEAFPVKVRT